MYIVQYIELRNPKVEVQIPYVRVFVLHEVGQRSDGSMGKGVSGREFKTLVPRPGHYVFLNAKCAMPCVRGSIFSMPTKCGIFTEMFIYLLDL